ncbi:MAG: hypothetical protein LBR11_09840 [Deltaproteobacteria bacterium]|jgi:hypothetical protein|nr:hypothetical protein [Deltaproteobacteria bacterium]
MASLAPEFLVIKEENPDRVTQADLVLGVLSKNDAQTMERVVLKLTEGWAQDYPQIRAVLALADCASQDDCVERFFQASCEPPKFALPKIALISPPERAEEIQALLNLMILAQRLQAKIIVVQSADTMTIRRSWLRRLIQPLVEDIADFTNPLYSRNAIDSPVTNLMVYPLFRALFGRRLRQPILTDWAFNDRVLAEFLSFQLWPPHPGQLSPELMVKALAVTRGFRVCQSIMTEGRYGLSNKRMDTPHIIGIFHQLARGFFEIMIKLKDNWRTVTRSRPTSVIGTDLKPNLYPVRYQPRLEELYGEIQTLLAATEPQWRGILANNPGDLGQYLKNATLDSLDLTTEQWGLFLFYCGSLFENLAESERGPLLEAMTPVFLARFLAFQKQTIGLSATQVETKVEEGAANLENLKRELCRQIKL